MAFQHFHLFNFLYKHKDAIDSFTSFASSAAGAASEVGGKYFEQIEEVLKDIERTYQSAFITRGTLIGEQFRVERAKHFKKLNILLNKFMKYKLGMSQYDDLRKALGLSSRSIMHRWSQSGVGGIEGYATYIDNSAKLVKAMKKLGYIGIALDFGNTTNNIYDACTVGRTSECKKKAFTEYGKFGASQTGNILGGAVAGRASGAVCMWGLGMLTAEIGGAGALFCTAIGLAGGIAGGEVIGSVMEDGGEFLGEEIYMAIYNE